MEKKTLEAVDTERGPERTEAEHVFCLSQLSLQHKDGSAILP